MPHATSAWFRVLTVLSSMLAVAALSPLKADYFKNGDLKEGLAGWHGDAQIAFLKADGTEGAEGDADVTSVLRLKLSSDRPREVSQEINLQDSPKTMHVKIDLFASADFKRSSVAQNYTKTWDSGTYYWSDIIIPTCDFWIRGGPGWFYKLGQATPGSWTTLDGAFDNLEPLKTRTISFCVAPGTGILYLKNATAQP